VLRLCETRHPLAAGDPTLPARQMPSLARLARVHATRSFRARRRLPPQDGKRSAC
jgi:hypothetical protein